MTLCALTGRAHPRWDISLMLPTAVVVNLSIVGAAEREIVGSTHDRYLVSE